MYLSQYFQLLNCQVQSPNTRGFPLRQDDLEDEIGTLCGAVIAWPLGCVAGRTLLQTMLPR